MAVFLARSDRFLGIDVGTTVTKLALFDERGRPTAIAKGVTPIRRPAEGWAEVNLDDLWLLILGLAKTLGRGNSGGLSTVAGIGLSTLCPGLTALSDDGRPLVGAIPFLDRRSLSEAEEAVVALGGTDRAFSLSGNRVMAGACSLTSMLWIRGHAPAIYAQTRYFGHIQTFLCHKLTREFAMDYSNAAYTGLFDTGGRNGFRWSGEAAAEVGLDYAKLPPLAPAWERVGGLSCDELENAGLPRGTPVAVGGGDTACAALGIGVVDHDEVFESAGTSGVLTICSDRPDFDDRFMNRCHVVPGRWLAHGTMSSTGAAMSWWKDEILRAKAEEWSTLFAEASAVPEEAEIPVFLPYMIGERSPVWDPNARGSFVGLHLDATRGHLTRAVMEGCAFGLRHLLSIIETRRRKPLDRVLAIGGWADCAPWAALKADILRRPVVCLEFAEAAARGAAMLGALAAGRFADPQEAIQALEPPAAREYRPSPRPSPSAEKRFRIYLELYPRLQDLYRI